MSYGGAPPGGYPGAPGYPGGAPGGYPGGPPPGGAPGGYPGAPGGAPGGYPGSAPYGGAPGGYPGAPGGYPGGPPPGAPYGAPPGGQYGAPPGGQYGAPPGGKPPTGAPPSGQYGPPPGQYGAPPGQYGAPPPGQYGAPPGQYGAPPGAKPPTGAPPPGQYGAPPAGQYGAPPGQYGAPPGQYGAPPGQYGAPPPGQYGPPGGAKPPTGYPGAPGGYGAPPGAGAPYGGDRPPNSAVQGGGHYGAPPAGGAGGWNAPNLHDPRRAQFFNAIHQNLNRDYIVLIDKSGSMIGKRWADCQQAVQALAPEICRCDPDGLTIGFFSTAGQYQRFSNIRTPQDVMGLFQRVYPGGTTDLGGALSAVLDEHFSPQRQKPGFPPGHAPTTILVITDGEPDDANEVFRVLINASQAALQDSELSISFIQVGDDDEAARFLRSIDDRLVGMGAKYDLCDTVTKDKMVGMSFGDLIFKSIHD